MLRYIDEESFEDFDDENVEMDIQVGPNEEITAGPKTSCGELNPVDKAKCNPNNVNVAAKQCCDGCCEFYVDANDIEDYAEITEQDVISALNDVLACNEEMNVYNTVLVLDRNNIEHAPIYEETGVNCCAYFDEAEVEDFEMDIQVGPGKNKVMTIDPQDANPLDAVKRQYNTVVVAQDDDDFFMDVEDVQKCAELNCESFIDAANKIMYVNEEYGMDQDNTYFIYNENAYSLDEIEYMIENGEILLEFNFGFTVFKEQPALERYRDVLNDAERLCEINGIRTRASALKAISCAIMILRVVSEAADLGAISAAIILPIPIIYKLLFLVAYLADQAIGWLVGNAEEAIAIKEGKRVVIALERAKTHCTDKKLKDEFQTQIDNIEDRMSRLNNLYVKTSKYSY